MKMNKTNFDNKNNGVEKRIIKPLECTLYVQMKPLWKFLRIFGLLPYVEVHETGDLAFYWVSKWMLYSMIIITTVSTLVVLIIISGINSIKSMKEPDFDRKVFHVMTMSTPSAILFIPITFWVDTKNFVGYVQNFAKFETDYYRIFKNKLKVEVRKCCFYILAIIVVYTVAATTMFIIEEREFNWYSQFPYIHIMVTLYVQLPYIGFLSYILIKALENIQKKLSKDALIKYDTCSAFREHRLLWLKLKTLSRDIYSTFVRAVIVYVVFSVACISVCAYTVVAVIRHRGFDPTAMIFTISVAAMFSQFYFTAYRSEILCNSIGKSFVRTFFKSRRNLNCYKSDAISEMRIFIQMLKGTDVKMTNGGYFSLNQSSFISSISLVTTYILIVVQFRSFQPKSALDGSGNNWNEALTT